jgi:hypothetical protein
MKVSLIKLKKLNILIYKHEFYFLLGEFVNGIKHGKGKIFYPNKDTFEGNFENGKKNGFGKALY